MAERAPPLTRETSSPYRGVALATLLFTGILGASAALGYGAYRVEVGAHRAELQKQMQAVARLKAQEIEHWLEERSAAVIAAATGPRIALDFERWQEQGKVDPALRDWLAKRLDRLRRFGGYSDVVVLGRDGEAILSDKGDPAAFRLPWPEVARAAMRQRAVVYSPLGRPGGPEDGAEALDAIAPLTAEDERGSSVVGALVFRIDPEKHLYPLIRSWPTDSPSAESLLVQADGGEVRYLNDLRHRAGAGERLRLSAADPELVAAKAIRGQRGVAEGRDYRGVRVLACIEEVHGTPWILVSKIDRAEAYAPLRDYLWIYLAFLLGAAVIAGLAARSWWRGVQEAALRREHEGIRQYVSALKMAEDEREKLIESLTRALDDVKTLRGIVPICASCKRIRDDAGYWSQVELYVSKHTEARFSHGICPECAKKLYPDYAE